MASKHSCLVSILTFFAQIWIACSSASARDLVLYGKTEVTIPFFPLEGNAPEFHIPPAITYYIVTDEGDSKAIIANLDTGSSAVLLGSAHWPNWGHNRDKIIRSPRGYEYLSSSRYMYYGYWVDSTIRFKDTGFDLTAKFPILVVTESFVCTQYDHTKPGKCPEEHRTPRCGEATKPCETIWFGVGFGREEDGQEECTPDKNALLNIHTINKQPIPKDFSVGYAITDKGVTVGLTDTNTAGYEMIKLKKLKKQSDILYAWQMVKGCIQVTPPGQEVSNPCVKGNILLDTGLAKGFLRLTPENKIEDWKSPTKGRQRQTIGKGYNITTYFGNNELQYQWRYTFITKEPPFAPASLTAKYYDSPGDIAFINTGVRFYKGHSIVFDAVNGLFGVKARPVAELTPTNPSN